MNALERVLQRDLDHLLDRLASSAREGTLDECAEQRPDLLGQIDLAESELSATRRDLLDAYMAWGAALDRCEHVWKTAGLQAEQLPEVIARAA